MLLICASAHGLPVVSALWLLQITLRERRTGVSGRRMVPAVCARTAGRAGALRLRLLGAGTPLSGSCRGLLPQRGVGRF